MPEKLENNEWTYAYAHIMIPYVDQTFEYYKYAEMDRREQGPEVVAKKEGKKAIMPTLSGAPCEWNEAEYVENNVFACSIIMIIHFPHSTVVWWIDIHPH